MRKRNVLWVAALAVMALIGVAGCDASAMLPAQTAAPPSRQASAAVTEMEDEEPTVTPLPTRVAPVASAAPSIVPSATTAVPVAAQSESAAASLPVPLSTFDPGGMRDLTGDGRRDTVMWAAASENGTMQLMLNGLLYETGIPEGTDTALYVQDMDADGASEIVCVHSEGRGAALRLYRLTPEGLAQAVFTYTVPAELSAGGAEEYRENSETLVFSGIEPIVALGDGSFAVLSFGSGFQRYVLGSDMHVTEAGTLPVGILTGGGVPAAQSDAQEQTDPS